jgi:hypothetical protein
LTSFGHCLEFVEVLRTADSRDYWRDTDTQGLDMPVVVVVDVVVDVVDVVVVVVVVVDVGDGRDHGSNTGGYARHSSFWSNLRLLLDYDRFEASCWRYHFISYHINRSF